MTRTSNLKRHFNNKLFYYAGANFTKKAAKLEATKFRKRGALVRIINSGTKNDPYYHLYTTPINQRKQKVK
jgi:hypothetical protein